MTEPEMDYLKGQLDTIYDLLKELPEHKIKGTTEHSIQYHLENINIYLDIPFND